jgi:hypothetical protein
MNRIPCLFSLVISLIVLLALLETGDGDAKTGAIIV